MQDLFRRCYQDFQAVAAKELSDKKIISISPQFVKVIQSAAERCITREFITSLATGNWRTGKIGQKVGMQTGVSQNLVRLSYAAAISQIRRTASDIEESSKAVPPRMLHSSQFGYLCPAETPEGGKVGLVKNFTLQCKISVEINTETKKVLQEIESFRAKDNDSNGQETEYIAMNYIGKPNGRVGVKVFFNGKWLGCVTPKDAIQLSEHLKKRRASSHIYYQTSIAYNESAGELVVSTDSGRVLRPLFVVRSALNRDRQSQRYQLVEYCELACKPHHVQEAINLQDGWRRLISHPERLIEYLDPYEEEQALICSDLQDFRFNQERIQRVQMWAKGSQKQGGQGPGTLPLPYTHMEIHPCLILSAISALIPFPDHNQAPRNLFQASMGKQAIGIYALNFQRRFDTQGINVLHSPQRPIGQTRTMRYVKFTDLPAGMNLIVAIAIYTGFNQEDSLIMSHAAVDCGLMRCTYYLSHEAICDPEDVSQDKQGLVQKIMIPSHCVPKIRGQIDRFDVEYLDLDGIPPIGQSITRGRVVIGKVTPCRDMTGEVGTTGRQFQDDSVLTKSDEIGYVDAAVLACDKLTHGQIKDKFGNTNRGAGSGGGRLSTIKSGMRAASLTAKVRVRQDRPPQLGDKFSSRHGQKGTVGMLYRHEDLPYTWDGVTPDIIVNPHAIPSRMTIGQLLECVGAKVGAVIGGSVDCTPFEPPGGVNTVQSIDFDNKNINTDLQTTVDELELKNQLGGVSGIDQETYLTSRLFDCGFQRTGYEAMFCGFTGRLLNYRIFIGPTFYQRLKHITLDKVSARSTGQVTTKYRQPVEGRSRGGGMRIGEMERDAFLAHGAAAVLRDRTMFSSDVTEYLVCRICGMIVWHADMSQLNTNEQPNCSVCKGEAEFAVIRMPHVCKQMFLEIMAMGILPKLIVKVD